MSRTLVFLLAALLGAAGCSALREEILVSTSEREEWLTKASGETLYRTYCVSECHRPSREPYLYELHAEDLAMYVERDGQRSDLRAHHRQKILSYLLSIQKNRPRIEGPLEEQIILGGRFVKRPPEPEP